MLHEKVTIILLTTRLIKKHIINDKTENLCRKSEGWIIELDLSYYPKKADLENATGADTSKLTEKGDLTSLKSEFDKLDIDKLEKVPTGLDSLKS